jgi:hypothetical protein
VSVLKETIQTLDVLFPVGDKSGRTQKLLKKHGQRIHDLPPFNQSRTLNLLEYHHWRERLQEVYEEIFLSPPVSLAQLWNDRRNPQQFWTFWIALVILLLTAVSTVTGIVQAWASIKGLH